MWVLVIAAVAWGGTYWYSLWRHPFRRCTACGGSKSDEDTTWAGAFGKCWSCGGTGRRIRWGARFLTPGAYRAIKGGEKGKNY